MNINGIQWLVMLVEPDNPVLWMGDGYTIGVTDLDDKIIYIANDLDGELLQDVIFHECTHAWIYSMGIRTDLICEELICQIVEKHSDEIQMLAEKIYSKM